MVQRPLCSWSVCFALAAADQSDFAAIGWWHVNRHTDFRAELNGTSVSSSQRTPFRSGLEAESTCEVRSKCSLLVSVVIFSHELS